MNIKTNNVPRETLLWHQLTEKEKGEFDYLDTEEKQQNAEFVRYKNWVYNTGEFMLVSGPELQGWDGYHSDSYFSGVLIKYVEDGERVVMGRYYV